MCAQKRPVNIYINLSKVTSHDIGGRKGSFELLSTLDFDRIAITGANLMLKYVVKLIVKASGKQNSVKITDNSEEAYNWLNEQP